MASFANRTELRTIIERRIGKLETTKLMPSREVIDDAVVASLAELDRFSAKRKVHESAGDGATRRFVLEDLVTGWKNGSDAVSLVAAVVDANTADEVEAKADHDEWRPTFDTSDRDVLLLRYAIPSDQTLRIYYTTPHVVDDSSSTVPEKVSEVLILMAVADVCEWIARTAADLTDGTFGKTEVDYSEVSDRFANRARRARERAREIFEPEDNLETGAASVEWDPRSQLNRTRRISH
jgi:hypothetical protein